MSRDIIERAEKWIADYKGVSGTPLEVIHILTQDRCKQYKMIKELTEYAKDLERQLDGWENGGP